MSVYNHNTSIDVVVEPYDEPVLDFTWTPDDPNITDTVIFSQDNNDIRNDSLNSYYGRIDEIKVDFHFIEAGVSTIFVYKKNNSYYIEQPYNGIYQISGDEYNSIEKLVR